MELLQLLPLTSAVLLTQGLRSLTQTDWLCSAAWRWMTRAPYFGYRTCLS